MIILDKVTKSFVNTQVLKGIDIHIDTGERVSLVGPGSCGKTLAIKILLGLIAPDKGNSWLLETNMFKSLAYEKTNTIKQVGMSFQQGGLFDFMTVRENLIFAMKNMTSKSTTEMNQTIESLLSSVKLPKTEFMYPYELSGGMQRRISIARALCTEPKIAIFDEPTAGLDPVTSTIILNMILALGTDSQKKVTLLVVTSNVETAIRFADRILIMNQGKIVADGNWRDLLLHGSDWVRKFLSVRFIGLDKTYAKELTLPKAFIDKHWP